MLQKSLQTRCEGLNIEISFSDQARVKQEGLEVQDKGKRTWQTCHMIIPKGNVTKREIKTQKDYLQAHQGIRYKWGHQESKW